MLAFDLPPTRECKIQEGVGFNPEASEKKKKGEKERIVRRLLRTKIWERILANKKPKILLSKRGKDLKQFSCVK